MVYVPAAPAHWSWERGAYFKRYKAYFLGQSAAAEECRTADVVVGGKVNVTS